MNKNILCYTNYFLFTFYFVFCTFISYSQPVTFNYTGAVQTYTVPACVNSIDIEAWGAQGSSGSSVGGLGGYAKGRMNVTAGQVLTVYVGGQSGFNGGGIGFTPGAGGGGASDVRVAPAGLANRIIVAGAGGGGGGGNPSAPGGAGGGGLSGSNYYGGGGGSGANGAPPPVGGVPGGADGGNGGASANYGGAGGGGGLNSGGGGGTSSPCTGNGVPGTLGNGGNGGGPTGAGGGGGGYYGGGGASCGSNSNAGGGGGCTWTGTLTNVTMTGGIRSGNGQVVITPVAQGFPPSAPGIITGLSNVCSGATSVNYSVSAVSGATSYTWVPPAGATITSGQGTTAISVTFGSSSGNISVTANNNCGSSAASTKAVTVNTVAASAGSDVTICMGQNTTLTASGGTNYLWSTGETTASITVSPSASTTYTLVVSDASGCSGSDEVIVTVNPPVLANAGSDTTICLGDSAILSASGASNYLWNTGEITATITVYPLVSTTYTVVVSDAIGCSGTDSITVTVDSCATGIFFSASNQNIFISPNPTTGKFYLSFSTLPAGQACSTNGKERGEVEIYNMMGEKILASPLAPLSLRRGDRGEAVDLSSQPAGIYFVKVIAEEEVFLSKIIKQ